jgi:hypothetical protein
VEGDIESAIADLEKKIVALNHSHYHPVHFILLYAAAGKLIKFYALSLDGKVMTYTYCGHTSCSMWSGQVVGWRPTVLLP